MRHNFRESKLVFFGFEGGKANDFVPKVQAAEKKVQTEKDKTTPDSGKADIVDEAKVKDKIEGIEKKIKDSPVSDKYKEQLGKSLTTLLDKRDKDLQKVDVKKEEKLKALFDQIVVDLDGFEKQPDVKDVYENIEPFFKNKDKLKPIIHLKTYRRGSGHWQKINADIDAKTGIKKDKIESVQKLLKIKIDGKTGPETMNALSKMLELGVDVEFDDKNTTYDGQTKSIEEEEAAKGDKPKNDPTQTDGKDVKAEVKPPNKPAEKVREVSAEEHEKINGEFKQLAILLKDLNIQIDSDKYADAYVKSNQKVPFATIQQNFQKLNAAVKASKANVTELIKIETPNVLKSLGQFVNGVNNQVLDSVIAKINIENEALAYLPQMETATAQIQAKAEVSKQKAQTFLDYAYKINGKTKGIVDKKGVDHKYDYDNYLAANEDLVKSYEDSLKAREGFAKGPDAEQRNQALDRVMKLKTQIQIPSIVENPSDKHLGISLKTATFEIPKNRQEFDDLKANAAMAIIVTRRQNYLETGDPKFKADFDKSQKIMTVMDKTTNESGLGQAMAEDGEKPENAALNKKAQENIATAGSDFNDAGKLRGSDPTKCYEACVALQGKLETYEKFGAQLSVSPKTQTAYLKIINEYKDKNQNLVLDNLSNNPKINDYNETKTRAFNEIQPAVQSISRIFDQIAHGKEEPTEDFMKQIHELAKGVIANPNLQKLIGHQAVDFYKNFKCFDFKGEDKFRGQINLLIVGNDEQPGIYRRMQDAENYGNSARNLCSKSLKMTGSPSELGTFAKTLGKDLAITTAAVAGAVLMGLAVAASGGIAGAGLLVAAGNFGIGVAATSLGAAVGSQYMLAAIEGNTDHMGSGVMLEAWGKGAMYSAAGGAAGMVLGKGLGIVASRFVQGSNGLSQRMAVSVAARSEKLFENAASAGTKVKGGLLSQAKHLIKEVASETGEELTEDAMQKIGEGLSPVHPELGFIFSLIPSALRTSKSTVIARTMGVSPRPGITGRISDESVHLQYSDKSEVVEFLKSRNMPAEIITKFEETGSLDQKFGVRQKINIIITPTVEPVITRQALSSAKGFAAARKFGLKFNEESKAYEFKDAKHKEQVVEFLKKEGVIVVEGNNGEIFLDIGGETVALKALKEVPAEVKVDEAAEKLEEPKNEEPKVEEPKVEAKPAKPAEKATDDAKVSKEEATQSTPKMSEVALKWLNERISKISDLKLREKVSEIFKAIGANFSSLTKSSFEAISKSWEAIRERVTDLKLRDFINKRLKTIKEHIEARAKAAEESKAKEAEADAQAKPADKPNINNNQDTEEARARPERARRASEFKVGDEIFVKRSDGSMDSGWKIRSIDEKTGLYTVFKNMENGQVGSYSDVTYEELKDWKEKGPKKYEEQKAARESQERARERARRANEFKVGQDVFIGGGPNDSDGIEMGWKIEEIHSDGTYTAGRYENGVRTHTKTVTYEQLKYWKAQGSTAAPRQEPREKSPTGDVLFAEGKLKPMSEISKMTPKEISDIQPLAKGLDFAQKIFGLKDGFTEVDVKKAYRKLSMEFHPDRNNSSIQASEMFKLLGEAKSTLDAYFANYGQKAA